MVLLISVLSWVFAGKKLWELVESCDERIKNVREFLEEVDPTLEYDVVAISDLFGPTKDDPTFEVIFISLIFLYLSKRNQSFEQFWILLSDHYRAVTKSGLSVIIIKHFFHESVNIESKRLLPTTRFLVKTV